jgi:hypothetical protein
VTVYGQPFTGKMDMGAQRYFVISSTKTENETACFTLYPSQLDSLSGKTQTRTSLAVIEIFMKLNRAEDFGPHQTIQLRIHQVFKKCPPEQCRGLL